MSLIRSIIHKIASILLVNSSRHYLYLYNRQFAASMSPGEYVLDAGAGDGPYRELFGHTHYESTDFGQVPGKPYASPTFLCDLCRGIPVEDGRYDYIVFNQVLEHLYDPQTALIELARV